MKKIFALLLCLMLLGCAGMITKWDCASSSCLPKEQAINKCLAQANSAFSRNKDRIWEQCMRGEGFKKIPCEKDEMKSEDCQLFHVR